MGWVRTESGMPMTPGTCTACGMAPMDEVTGKYLPAFHMEGVDVDWGNHLYICWNCGEILADLAGRATRGAFDEMEKKLEVTQVELAEALEKLEDQETLLDKIREGGKAQKRVREGAKA